MRLLAHLLQPLGLPNLKPRDQLKQRDNLFMRFSAFLLSLACRFCIPATLENPQWSRLWLCPPILAILRLGQVSLVMTTFCAWGSPFRKATSFLSVYVDLWRLQDHKCTSSRRWVCEYSQAKHVPIQWWTKIAEQCERQGGDKCKLMRPKAPRVGDKAAQNTQSGKQVWETGVGDKWGASGRQV